ncbi:hypothetical protein V7S43_001631 [Phytophthora oleae]|uniref:Uncharacterized protein n=1 Tax=Phytophthora oleae TaxID=2107226 RepID=A0ABD3G803_9STRA
MTQAILALADAHKTLAVTSAARQESDCMCKLSCSDVAIKAFKEQLANTIEMDERYRFIQLLAMNQSAATMYCGMDDECRRYFVQEFLAGNTDFQ